MTDGSIEQIDKALARYYKHVDKEYKNQFSEYCEDNGLEDDGIADEIDQKPSDCILVEFDDDFPFKGNPPKDTTQFIYDIIRKCREDPDIIFGGRIPDFSKLKGKLFSDLDLEEITAIYKLQCKTLWTPEWLNDEGLLMVLAAGKKRQFEYLMHLVDDYGRYRIKHVIEDMKTPDSTVGWSLNHKHFETLANVSLDVKKKEKIQKMKYKELATSAVSSFGKRVCTPMQLNGIQSINDSLKDTVDYIYGATKFISLLLQRGTTVCPFQIDFCIASGAPIVEENKQNMNDDEDDDDDDDDDDDADIPNYSSAVSTEYVDCVDDVQKKLDKNGIKYVLNAKIDDEKDTEGGKGRVFNKLYDNLLQTHELKGSSKGYEYLHKKRLISMVDRRDGGKKDDVWMYEAPKGSRNLPDKAIPEWYINASVECVLPGIEEEKKDTDKDKGKDKDKDKDKDEKDAKDEDKEALKRANIGAKDHCKAGLLTLSFHVKQEKFIKCYLYWNAGILRFLPEDIKTVLPMIYNMKGNGNKAFIEDKDGHLGKMIEEMKKIIVDDEFKQFQCSYM